MRVMTDPTLHPRRFAAFDVVVRAALIAAVALLIFGVLPAVADAAG